MIFPITKTHNIKKGQKRKIEVLAHKMITRQVNNTPPTNMVNDYKKKNCPKFMHIQYTNRKYNQLIARISLGPNINHNTI